MKNILHFLWGLIFLCLLSSIPANGQEYSGEVFFNQGSTSGAINPDYQSSTSIGQPIIGSYFGIEHQGNLGFWSRFLLAPSPPILTATEGDFPDRIQIEWRVDALSPVSDLGFNVYRDGAFLAHLEPSILQFIDFNVIPGIFYNYEVRGVNEYGEGYTNGAVGFVNPNGTVTGQVTTINNNPVGGVQVTLEPTIGKALSFDGSGDYVEIPYDPVFTSNEMTVSAWVKIGDTYAWDGILDLGRASARNWWIATSHHAFEGKGLTFGMGAGGDTYENETILFDTLPDDWHYAAFTYNGTTQNIYLDGVLKATRSITMDVSSYFSLFMGKTNYFTNNDFDGKLDDVRIYNRQLSQTEITRTMNATVPSNAEGLVAYWKLDEGIGYKVFDLAENQLDGIITDATFSDDRPDILNAGITDESGYYLIDGINYGGGQSFTARPNKSFEYNNGLEFNATNQQYATLADFVPSDSSGTIELWFKPSVLTGQQTILHNAGLFDLSLNGTAIELSWNGSSVMNLGTISTTDYVHVAIKYDPVSSPNMTTYINGTNENTFSVSPIDNSAWENTTWNVGRNSVGTNYFTGIVDEIVFYNNARTQPQIQADGAEIDLTDLNLVTYFSLNESVGTTIGDQSPTNVGMGNIYGATWTSVTANPNSIPHEFNPSTRIVTLDPTNVSVDNVDFEDISTVSVSGFVFYQGTQCPAENVEILVDGVSNVPPIYTDEFGEFVADFEPGSSFRLSPKFKDHQFIPNFWDINQIVVPKAGIAFKNQETRTVEGIFAGGLCEESIVSATDSVVINLRAANGNCFDRNFVLEDSTIHFEFENIPPIEYIITVAHHSDNNILTYINNTGGGKQIDLEPGDTSVAFIYRSDIQIETTDLPLNDCGLAVLDQNEKYQFDIKVYEEYVTGKCYLDSVQLTIDNQVSGGGANVSDSTYNASKYKHKFYAGAPNILAPYTKPITITAKDGLATSRVTAKTVDAIVAGKLRRPAQFVTVSPEMPWLILRDPPGDGSYSSWESGTTQCAHYSQSIQTDKSLSNKTTLSLGAQFETGSLFWFTETEITADVSAGFTSSSSQVSSSEERVCMTATNTISTSANEEIVGGEMGGDVYVGGAMNLIFGITDELSMDSLCQIQLDTSMSVEQNGMATQYVYSEYYVKEILIPQLEVLGKDTAIAMWNQVIAKNEATKAASIFSQNYSFDGGVIYEYSKAVETEQAITLDWETTFSNDFAIEAGFKIGGNGVNNETTFEMSTTIGGSKTTSTSTENTVTYHFEDNDVGDNFTVDVLEDKVFGVPVFNLKSGQSSCPHEPGTQNRDQVSLSVAESVMANVPETEPAVFVFTLGNTSPSQETRTYELGLGDVPPSGVQILINGLAPPVSYTIESGETAEATVTLTKVGADYIYEDIEIAFNSVCEADRADALGIDPEPEFEQVTNISAYFIESCTDVNISDPLNGFVVTPSDNNIRSINLVDFDASASEFQLLRVQFRPTNGNGAWVNITEIPKDSLTGLTNTAINWNVSALSDGEYEIRAVSQCEGGLPASISDIITGRLEREPPALLGTPQPADGILQAADLISIEFTENIDCSNLSSIVGGTEDYVNIFDATTGQPIDIDISCLENKIVITPNIQNKFIENKLLRAEVKGIKDLTGNKSIDYEWEFYVDRNPLSWVEGDIDDVKYDGENWVVTRTIQNVGGQTEVFTLEDVPNWITPSLLTGEVAPGATALIVFTVANDIAHGSYTGTIQLSNPMGDEPLNLDLAVLCPPPLWEVNGSLFEFNMQFTVELDIEGTVSEDENDLVAAFIDGELRGVSALDYYPSIDKTLAFLNVFSDQVGGEEVTFQIWDASECLLYGVVLEKYTFGNDGSYGAPSSPETLHTQSIVLKEIPIHNGWNWISFNLNMPDKNINTVMESLEAPDDLIMKSQSQFSTYFGDFDTWVGALDTLGYTEMYKVKGTQDDTITLLGYLIDPDTVVIQIDSGWNWIGYLPQQGAHVDDALSNLTPLTGDIIKGQNSFAQYVAGVGWVGSLSYMEAPNGYLLNVGVAGTINMTAPEEELFTQRAAEAKIKQVELRTSSVWDINPSEFEHSMTMTAVIHKDDSNHLKPDDEIAAFVGDEVRGVAKSIYVDALDVHLMFLTVYANQENEILTFKYHDSETGIAHDLNETVTFIANENIGTVSLPEIFTMTESTSIEDLANPYHFIVQPNPFRDKAVVSFNMENLLTSDDEITLSILDVVGKVVQERVIDLKTNGNQIEIEAVGDDGKEISPGVYFINLKGTKGRATKKILIVR